jgi:hypothetical protein
MKFDPHTGSIEFAEGLYLRRGMTRSEVLGTTAKWEDWIVIDDIPRAFRALINLPNKNIGASTILIVYVGIPDRPIAFWDLAPWDLTDGVQNRPEGKYTKRIRIWFEDMFKTKLPVGGDWGHIDASYDPHNQSVGIICNYRERFPTDTDWHDYRKRNKF